jgi:hypothetical protein
MIAVVLKRLEIKNVLKYTLTRYSGRISLRQKRVVNHQEINPSRGVLMYIYLSTG